MQFESRRLVCDVYDLSRTRPFQCSFYWVRFASHVDVDRHTMLTFQHSHFLYRMHRRPCCSENSRSLVVPASNGRPFVLCIHVELYGWSGRRSVEIRTTGVSWSLSCMLDPGGDLSMAGVPWYHVTAATTLSFSSAGQGRWQAGIGGMGEFRDGDDVLAVRTSDLNSAKMSYRWLFWRKMLPAEIRDKPE